MKYIRTKNGIYEVIKNELGEYIKIDYYYGGFVMLDDIKDKIIKEADTIEELCDTYVFVGDDKDCYGHPLLWNIKQDIPFLMKYYYEQNIIYGAIWTDKGLIYVAKLNEAGELVLI